MFDLPAEAIDGPGGADQAKSDQGLASSADTLSSVLQVDEGETVYDYAWYPGMLVSQPASCVFACTARVGFSHNPYPSMVKVFFSAQVQYHNFLTDLRD